MFNNFVLNAKHLIYEIVDLVIIVQQIVFAESLFEVGHSFTPIVFVQFVIHEKDAPLSAGC